MNIDREKRRCRPDAGRLHFSGGSSSSAQTTNNYDQRVVGGDKSQNLSLNVSGEKSTITLTDQGAVAAASDIAKTSLATSAASSQQMFGGALAAVTDANKQLALAYQSGQAGDQTQLKYAGFVVVGLAVVMLLPRILKG